MVLPLGTMSPGVGGGAEDEAEAEVVVGLLGATSKPRPSSSSVAASTPIARTRGTSTSSGPLDTTKRDRVALEERCRWWGPGR